jgi:general secretion pathway protein H
MIVLGIIAAVIAIGLPRMNFKNDNIKKVVRELSVLTREVRNQARLKNRTYRIVFNMPKDQKGPGTYWVEYAEGALPAPSAETLEKQKAAAEKAGQAVKQAFQRDTKILKKDREIPSSLAIGQIETLRTPEPQTAGEAAVYFSPEGLVEKAAIQITNRKQLTWTLIINPLTGHADIVEKAVALKDVTRE